MILTKQQAVQALKKNKFIGFTIKTGNIIMKKMNKTDYNIFVFEEGKDKPVRYVGSIMNVMATMSDKASNKDFVIVELYVMGVQHPGLLGELVYWQPGFALVQQLVEAMVEQIQIQRAYGFHIWSAVGQFGIEVDAQVKVVH